uniref:Carboxylesterase type B domain-containing protein n=1 Tax=Eptatretus burgeri TaxID=7764 RepID=A0A8C4QCW2_EPTBU
MSLVAVVWLWLWLCLSHIDSQQQQQQHQSLLTSSLGKLRGERVAVPGPGSALVDRYLAVPYAAPPIGELRFRPPEVATPWDGLRDARSPAPVCPQAAGAPWARPSLPAWLRGGAGAAPNVAGPLPRQSEDCLYLNLYVPVDDGFLSTGDMAARGNYGLLDQVAALRWLSINAEHLGADPLRVTVFGSGAGAACVHLLTLSHRTEGNRWNNATKGLFQRAILQSGTALASWAISYQPAKYARRLAERLDCNLLDTAALVGCLRSRPARQLAEAAVWPAPYHAAFGPVIDGDVVSDDPRALMEQGEFLNYDVMTGLAQTEGLRFMYTDWANRDSEAARRRGLAALFTDHQWLVPAVATADLHARYGSPTYFYTFQHECTLSAGVRGNTLGLELLYVFGVPLVEALGAGPQAPAGSPKATASLPCNFSRADAALSAALIAYWTNFAKTGDPNRPLSPNAGLSIGRSGRFDETAWAKYTPRERRYLHVGLKPRLREQYRATRVAFWLHLVPQLHNPHDMFQHTSTTTKIPPSDGMQHTQRRNNRPLAATRPTPLTRRGERHPPPASSALSPAEAPLLHDYSTELSVTIAVGSSLLLLNVIAFAALYHRRDRRRQGLLGGKVTSPLRFQPPRPPCPLDYALALRRDGMEGGGPASLEAFDLASVYQAYTAGPAPGHSTTCV